jgi:hypothetical protein
MIYIIIYYVPKNEVILYSIQAVSVADVTRAHDQYDIIYLHINEDIIFG